MAVSNAVDCRTGIISNLSRKEAHGDDDYLPGQRPEYKSSGCVADKLLMGYYCFGLSPLTSDVAHPLHPAQESYYPKTARMPQLTQA